MKVFAHLSLAVSALAMTTVYGDSFVDSLTEIDSSNTNHSTPVRVLHARVQGDAPLWNETTSTFGSMYADTAEEQFLSAMDTVNTASVEGALMYVQAEGINYNTRGSQDQCTRKNDMKYVVFYDIVFVQTNEAVDEYGTEWGPMLPMDGGQCTPTGGSADSPTFSEGCLSLNGTSKVEEVGPFVGGQLKATDPRAPYPDCWWYSFPNTCPLEKWEDKTEECRASTRQGLCDMDVLPDGETCTFNYRILGYVPIDDVVGITAMTNEETGETYKDFEEFCEAGGVEFKATEAGVWNESIPFWRDPQDSATNALRSQRLVEAYAELLDAGESSQIDSDVVAHMQALPTVEELTAANPPCFENIEACDSEYGCKRENYGQVCTVCKSEDECCVTSSTDLDSWADIVGECSASASASASGSSIDLLSASSWGSTGGLTALESSSDDDTSTAAGSSSSDSANTESGAAGQTLSLGAAAVSAALFFFMG